MAFVDEVVKDGRAYAMRFDVSTDEFATIAYRWATHAARTGSTQEYQARVASVGSLSRGLGTAGEVGVSSLDLELDNTDGALDWLVSREIYATVTTLRVRAYVIVWNAQNGYGSETEEMRVGDFMVADMPTLTGAILTLKMADAVIGKLEAVPLFPQFGLFAENLDDPPHSIPNEIEPAAKRKPIPYVYGRHAVPLDVHIVRKNTFLSAGLLHVVVPFRSGGNDSASDSGFKLWCEVKNGEAVPDTKTILEVPASALQFNGYDTQTRTIWTVASAVEVASDDGTTHDVSYVQITVPHFFMWFAGLCAQKQTQPVEEELSPSLVQTMTNVYLNNILPGNKALYTKEKLGVLLGRGLWLQDLNPQTAGEAIAGLVATMAAPPDIDAASFDDLTFFLPSTKVDGAVDQGASLRSIIGGMATSCDFDVFTNWDGELAACADVFRGEKNTGGVSVSSLGVVELSDKDVTDVGVSFPSIGERNFSPAGFSLGNQDKAFGFSGRNTPQSDGVIYNDPDHSLGTVDRRGTVVEIPSDWSQNDLPLRVTSAPSQVRPRIRFRTDMRGLQLEIGKYFRFTYTRGVSAIFSRTWFQVEGITLNFASATVEVEAIWRAEAGGPQPYTLDERQYNLRVASGGGRTATVEDDNAVVTFSSGSLVSDGVVPGDILVLKDSTQGAADFQRFRAIPIAQVTSTTTLQLGLGVTLSGLGDPFGADLDFDAASPVAVTDWEIRAGPFATGIDAGDYPDGYDVYGKMSGSSSEPYDVAEWGGVYYREIGPPETLPGHVLNGG